MTHTSGRQVAEQIVNRLARAGVERVFGIPGGASSALDHALFMHPDVEHVICQHEGIAGYMAMGYHLATGLPGVATVTSGPGVLNIAPAIASARLDEVGLIVLAGDVATTSANRGALQDGGWSGLDTIHVMRSLGGLAMSADRPEQAIFRLERALDRCRSSPRGPAFLQIPIDVQSASVAEPAIEAGAPRCPVADAQAVEAAANLIRAAHRPCLFVGLGVKRAGVVDEVRTLAEQLACPVLSDAEAFGILPREHPLYRGCYGVGDTGEARRFLLEDRRDLIVVIGARLDDTTTNGYSAELMSAPTIQLDYDPNRIGRSTLPRVSVCGDLGTTLRQLLSCLESHSQHAQRPPPKTSRTMSPLSRSTPPQTSAAPFDPRVIVAEISNRFSGSTFTSDIGNHLLAALGYLNVDSPDDFHFSLGLGGMGSGIGMAMGMAAAPLTNRRIVCICGDGGLLMSGNDVITCCKYNIPVILLVLNNGQLGMVEHGIRNVFGRSDEYKIDSFNVVDWATSLGADAVRINRLDDLDFAARWTGPGPLVVDIPTDPSVSYQNPREGLIAFPAVQQ